MNKNMTYEKTIAIISMWIAPAIAIIYTKEPSLGWGFLFAVFGTDIITKCKEVESKNISDEEVINITKKFSELEYNSQEYTSRFKGLLDSYVFCNENELTNGGKKLRYKVKKFCIDMLK